MRTVENLSYRDGLCLDLYLPEEEHFDVFVYFHGGGLTKGKKDGADVHCFAPWLTARGVAVASAEYRLYPDAVYPDFIEDAAAAVAWVKAHIGEYGRCRRLFVGGSSAGGYLSMMLCFDGRYLGAHGIDPLDVDGYIHNAGQPTAHFKILQERGYDKRRLIVDETCPMWYVGSVERYAPMLFVVADNDMQNRYEQTVLMVSTLKHFGHVGDTVQLKVMEGYTHTAYTKVNDEAGDSVFGKLVLDFMECV